MRAAVAVRAEPADPLAALDIREMPEPASREGWCVVNVRAASLNHHDVWSLRGVGVRPEAFPLVLGCDGAGVDEDGNEVIIHCVVGDPAAGGGDETFDPRRQILGEGLDGTLAERIAVPRRNLILKPARMSFEEAACLPVAWLTAYRMLFTRSGVAPGGTILVQGAGGGVTTALIMLGAAAGYRVWVTSRSPERRARALSLGADEVFEVGVRLPQRVDAVMETVGAATWEHSLGAVRSGGRIVIAGATSGDMPPAGLKHIFFRQVSVIGSTAGTRDELSRLVRFCEQQKLTPPIDRVLPLGDVRSGLAALHEGAVFGKVVISI